MSLKTKILMFEDDNFTVDFNTLLFVNEGYEVRCYQDVDDVIERVKAYDPSIILMDLRIPSIGGAEATRMIKNDPNLKDIPVIIYSADMKLENAATEVKADGFIKKPFDINEMLDLIKQKTK